MKLRSWFGTPGDALNTVVWLVFASLAAAVIVFAVYLGLLGLVALGQRLG